MVQILKLAGILLFGVGAAGAQVLQPGNGGSGVANTATHTLGSANQNWATLGTGIVKNTTTTGAITDAVVADIIALFSGTCNGSTVLLGDGSCGTVTSGINQLTGDVTAGPGTGSQAATVVKINGASVPISQTYVGTNGSGQIVAATTPTSGINQLTSDVTAGPGTGSQAATIANGVVTLAKIANAAASSRVLGSGSSGSGASYSELSLGSGLSIAGTVLSATGTGGTVTTSGSPASGNLTKFSGSTAITNGDLSGDATTSGTLAVTLAAQYKKGSCSEVWGGSGTSFALVSGDDSISNNTCYNDSGVTRTITAVKCRSDVGSNTTTVNPTFGSAGTGTTILSGALTCGSSLSYSSSGTVSNASWTTGTGINPAMAGTLTGTSIAMIVEYTF